MLKPEEIRARREKIKAARERINEKKNAALDRARQIHSDAIAEWDAAMQATDLGEMALQDECPHANRAAGQSVCPDCGRGGRR
jgi:hypothetical protein